MNLDNRTIYIGDNLPVLRGINSASVDLVYLDPPFNSNEEYSAPIGGGAREVVFKDAFTLDDVDEAVVQRLVTDGEPPGYVIAAAGQAVGESTQAYLTYMWERLAELRRILKPDGAIYLHCDDTEAAWLKALMDAVFGRDLYCNEIIWNRTSAHSRTKAFGRVADHLLFYGDKPINADDITVPADPAYLEEWADGEDERGPYRRGDLTGPGRAAGESAESWRGFDPNVRGRHWAVPRAEGMTTYGDWIAVNVIPEYRLIAGIHDRLDALDAHGLIHWPQDQEGVPRLKRYVIGDETMTPGSIWDDIRPIHNRSRERTGFPTQKPLALLRRIILASSNEGDFVLDPFCGCATACVAAEQLGRRWVGIDYSEKAGELVVKRLREGDDKIAIWAKDVKVLREPPERTDDAPPPLTKEELKAILYERQDGRCAGTGEQLPMRLLELDRILPGAQGGEYTLENTQLLCGWCNRTKGPRDMAYLRRRIAELEADEGGGS